MKRSSCSHLWRLWVLLAGLAATSTTWADALSAVEVLREGGCGGTMPAAPPLRHNPMLDRAAAMWAMGQSLPVASERNGYRGDFTAGMHISGPDSATLELLRRSGCRIVAGRGMRDIGEYRRGFDTWLVVGSSYRLPPGLQASTGTWMPGPAQGSGATGNIAACVGLAGAADNIAAIGARNAVVSVACIRLGRAWNTSAGANCSTFAGAIRDAGTGPRSAAWTVAAAATATATAASASDSSGPLSTAALSPAQATRALQLVNDVRARGTHCGDELFGPAPPVRSVRNSRILLR